MKLREIITTGIIVGGCLWLANFTVSSILYHNVKQEIENSTEYFEMRKNIEERNALLKIVNGYKDFLKKDKIPELEERLVLLEKSNKELQGKLRPEYRKAERYYGAYLNPLIYLKKG